jgi:hypothetical protein
MTQHHGPLRGGLGTNILNNPKNYLGPPWRDRSSNKKIFPHTLCYFSPWSGLLTVIILSLKGQFHHVMDYILDFGNKISAFCRTAYGFYIFNFFLLCSS